MRVPLLILLATSALAFTAACGASEEEVPGDAANAVATPAPSTAPSAPAPDGASVTTPGPGVTLWRWANVTVLIPVNSDVSVSTEGLAAEQKPPNGGLAVRLVRDTAPGDDTLSTVLIDAETGTVVYEQVLDEDRAAIKRLLDALAVSELDRATAPWPYSGTTPADSVRENLGSYSFIRPSADTGLHVSRGIGDPGGEFIGIGNGKSFATVSLDGQRMMLLKDVEHVLPEDRDVFERWLVTVRLCGVEIKC